MALTIVKKTPLSGHGGRLTVMGLDISTKTGVAVLDLQNPGPPLLTMETVQFKKVKGRDDRHQFARWAEYELALSQLVVDPPTLVVIEGYGFASHSLSVSVEVGTHLRRVLYTKGIPWVEVAPAKLKKFVTGVGKGDKDVMMLEAYKRFGIYTKDNDQCDAACLAFAGAYLINPPHVKLPELPKANLEALKGVDIPSNPY